MTVYILKSILALCFFFAAFNAISKAIHYFQLSSYQYGGFCRTIFRIRSFFVPHALCVILLLPIALFVKNEYVAFILCSFFYIIFGLCRKPDKLAKKPLAYTPRVKRLLFTSSLLIAGSICGMFFIKDNSLSICVSIAFYALCGVLFLIANIINTPIEKSINQHYINDAKRILKNHNIPIIGITGSFGKTTMKFYLTTLLGAKFDALCTPSSFNTPLGIVRTIRGEYSPLTEVFVCEMGARHVGDIKEICDIVHPDLAIITSIGQQHLETFHTFENIRKTKLELADAVEKKCKGKIFINADSVKDAKKTGYTNVVTYGLSEGCDYHAKVCELTENGTVFTITTPEKESHTFTTKLLGEHNVQNLTGAVAVAHSMGIALCDLDARIMRIKPVAHRQELRTIKDGIIIDDAFNANPVGAKASLDTLSQFDGYRIMITPGMVELGEKEYELNRIFGTQAADVCDRVYLVGKVRTKPIYEGLISKGYAEDKIGIYPTFKDAYAAASTVQTDKRRIILIENDLPDNY